MTLATDRSPTDHTRLAGPTDPVGETVQRGQQAWTRLRSDSTWEDWVAVAKAHSEGRILSMREAHVKAGARFKQAFSEWLKRAGFDDLDKGDRSRLFKVIDHLSEIEDWRATLTAADRRKLNHPNTVLRHWQKAVAKPSGDKKSTRVEQLKKEVSLLKKQLARKDDDHLWRKADTTDDIATIIGHQLPTANKMESVARALLKRAKERRALEQENADHSSRS